MKPFIQLLFCIIFLLITQTELHAQEKHKPDLKPYSEFNGDSIAYLKVNFGSGGINFYRNHPIKDLLEDLDIKIKTVEINIGGSKEWVWMLNFFVQSSDQLEFIENRVDGYPLAVTLEHYLTKENGELYDSLTQGHRTHYWIPFDEDFQKLIEPLIIGSVYYYGPKQAR